MKTFKKFLSIILSVSFLFISTLPVSVLAEEDDCPKNSKGGYVHPECAYDELLKVGYNIADYIDVENLGVFGNEEHYTFNFRALDEVFEKKKLISTKNLNEQYNSLEKSCEYLSNIWKKDNILFIIGSSLVGAITGLLSSKGSKKIQGQINSDASFNTQGLQQNSSDSNTIGGAFSSLIRGVVGAVVGATSTIIGLKIKSEKDKKNVCSKKRSILHEIVETNKANEAKAHMLNILLYFLERPEHINFDMVYYISRADENDFHWDQKFAGINYTKEEWESFPRKFKEVAAKIRKNLAENKELTPDNIIPPDNSIPQEICINCKQLGN